MSEWIDWVWHFEFTGLIGILLYWSPAALCVYGYTIRTWVNFQKDVKNRLKAENSLAAGKREFYCPTDRIGDLIGRAVVTCIPVANLWAALFDVAPEVFSRLFEWLSKAFNQPLVPERRVPDQGEVK